MQLLYLFAAYTVVWLGIFLYLFSLGRRSRTLDREVRELRQLLARSRE